MKVDKFKAILKKNGFPTMTAFCRVSGEDRYELQKLLSMARHSLTPERSAELDRLAELAKKHKGQLDPDVYVTDELRGKMKEAIDQRGGVISFSSENDFSRDSIFQILSGRRKKRTKKVNELLTILNL
jgi:hypothetical protein